MTAPVQVKNPGSLPLRVMLVDDSAVIRGIVSRWIEADPDLQIVASCGNGEQAIALAPNNHCDVVVLDIEMPVMDGLTALPKLLKAVPGLQVVMSSTLTRRNADCSLRALSLGAADYIAKPETMTGNAGIDDFRRELIAKIKALGLARRNRPGSGTPGIGPSTRANASTVQNSTAPIKLRPMPHGPFNILAIGSSTGGPNALLEVLRVIGPSIRIPVVITQHMPPTFTTLLAENIARVSGKPCTEGQNGQTLEAGHIYVAPGGQHMEIMKRGVAAPTIALNTNPPENFCRPAVDPLFRSVASVYGARAFGVVLTGMGSDGREGARALVAAGSAVVAQDEATSIVWGMPGAVAQAGLCSAIWPLSAIGTELKKFVGGGTRSAP